MSTNKEMNATAKKIVDFLTTNKGKEYTFADICKALDLNVKSTGAITKLLKSDKNPNGIISHGVEVEREVIAKKKFQTYKID